MATTFEWDEGKDNANRAKHGIGFTEAQEAFFDRCRLIFADLAHGSGEKRYFCLAWSAGGC